MNRTEEIYRGYRIRTIDPRLGGGYSVNGVQTSHLQLARDAVDEWLGGPLMNRTEGLEEAQREADRVATFCVGPAGYCDCEVHHVD